MKLKSSVLLVAVCLSAFVVTSCGDSSSSDTGSTTSGQSSGGDENEPDASKAQITALVEACKANFSSVPELSDELKQELTAICDQAASGTSPDDVVAANKKVCLRIADEKQPAGAARDQAIKICEAVHAPGALTPAK